MAGNREIDDLLDIFEGRLTAQSLALYITVWAVAGANAEIAESITKYLDLTLEKLSEGRYGDDVRRPDVMAELALVRARLVAHLETLPRGKPSDR